MPFIYAVVFIVLVAGDQALKMYVHYNIPAFGSHQFIPGIVSLTNITNNGAAWSMLEGKMLFFFIVTIIAVIVLLYLFIKSNKNEYLYRFSLLLLFTGTIGNAIDRFTHHYVIDMFSLDFMNFPIFNLADTYITVGVILLLIYLFRSTAGENNNK
ncbi:signal peptidase II [Companilactobacillus mishanensis]|uniref:Lipoprotein signal peptidase n=1 Tax=Companilactobacillus mishanensis TaxID=2486008 RepID=A0A5P0ZF38_9LACO|nr:signal peptidase II [Companilactobacillus mishanensis]MQS44228.1 signal peptidase II [Companilactobacillus mishanensis]MQS51667.1 signal peptidase II [Companilactobacillus mishanensis]MQS88522.1 signal peptidase II [Companilactobacillus mishanensis]